MKVSEDEMISEMSSLLLFVRNIWPREEMCSYDKSVTQQDSHI